MTTSREDTVTAHDRSECSSEIEQLEYGGADRDDHQRQPRQAQRVRRRDGRARCSRSSPSCRDRPTSGRSSGAARASRSRRAATSARSATSKVELSHHELMRRGHRGIQQLWELDAPVIVALQGLGRWAARSSGRCSATSAIAAEGARFLLPEVTHGVIPDTGGVARALPDVRATASSATWCSPAGSMTAEEALRARRRQPGRAAPTSSTPSVREMAEQIAAAPAVTVKLARRVIRHLAPAADPRVDGRRDDRPDLHQQVRRHGRAARRARRGPRAALHRELTRPT